MKNGLATTISLTSQERITTIHALVVLKEEEHRDELGELLLRLQKIPERVTQMEFSKEEVRGVADVLIFALRETQKDGVERYGHFSIAKLEQFLDKIKEVLRRFEQPAKSQYLYWLFIFLILI